MPLRLHVWNRLLTPFGCLRSRHFIRNGAKMTHGKQQTGAEKPFDKNFLMPGLLATVLFTWPIESGAGKTQRCFLLILTIPAFPFHGRLATPKASAALCSKGGYDVPLPDVLVFLLCPPCQFLLAP